MVFGALFYWRMYRISFRRRFGNGAEGASPDDVALDFGKPQLDLLSQD